ncbi:helicase-related protein, partial [Faecalibaculum rodentium]
MEKLEQILPGALVEGIEPDAVTIEKVKWQGNSVLSVQYKDAMNRPGRRFLFRYDEPKLSVVSEGIREIPGETVKLLLETLRMQKASSLDPFLAVETSGIQPLPHQISAVYQEMLPRIPLRFLLADDPGAGKTIMTGLLIKELIVREDMKRCLIVCPGGLAEQWKDELKEKFSLDFEVLNARILKEEEPFNDRPFCISSMDILARNDEYKEKLKHSEWDLIVVDEAHKLSASVWGNDIKYSKRYLLGKLLSSITKNFLLLTATPHNGKPEDFELFMSLLDPDRFEGAARHKDGKVDVSDLMRRMVKESLLKFDGTPLFPKRYSYTAEYSLSPMEKELYEAVSDYVRHEFNRAERLQNERKAAVGFALTVLQRRLASSPEAIYQSLKRRRHRLEQDLATGAKSVTLSQKLLDDDYPSSKLEEQEDQSFFSGALTREELAAEIRTLKQLEQLAEKVRQSGQDRKWEELSELLQSQELIYDPQTGQREKLIIFTEHKDTLHYLKNKLETLLGSQDSVLTISGSTSRRERKVIADVFRNDPEASILLATDAAGEGINLQNAHLMINYDLPWNPNRLEQRFGRIHRIGQQNDCYLWNLCSRDTREGVVYTRLLQKLETEKGALQGKVFDILGKISFQDKSLKDLLLEAVTGDRQEEILASIDQEMNPEHLKQLMKDEALTEELMDKSQVFEIREEMERQEVHRLQPHFVEAYFLALVQHLGGQVEKKEDGTYEVLSLPHMKDLPRRYRSIYFEPDPDGEGELISPEHPLLQGLMKLFMERHAQDLKSNMVLMDPNASREKTLYVFKGCIEDGMNRILEDRLWFVLEADGRFRDAGYAPYLDYQPAKETRADPQSEAQVQAAEEYTRKTLMEQECQRLRRQRVQRIEKARTAVRSRLHKEIQYWDLQYIKLKKEDPLNARKADDRATELARRLKTRLEQFRQEEQIRPKEPELIATVRILPGLGESKAIHPENKKAVELAGMQAVFDIEKQLGNIPRDVSEDNVGYDIESRSSQGKLRFIEVKGRQKGSDTVTVTKNEILTALNKPEDFILAIVEVDGNKTRTTYLKQPFTNQPDFSIASINYHIKDLIEQAGEAVIYGTEETSWLSQPPAMDENRNN